MIRWYHWLFVAGIAVLCWAASNALMATADFWTVLFDKNPGIATVFVSSFLLPIAILYLNNRQNTKLKSVEARIATDKAIAELDAKSKHERNSRKAASADVLHSSLVKLLFEVQRLHIQLSTACVDYSCIDKAIEGFNEAFTKYQSIIADNQLNLSPRAINLLYAFYKDLSSLLIELNNFKTKSATELAIVSVFKHSQRLSDYLISIQELILRERDELESDFDRSQLDILRQCCGREPSYELQEQYEDMALALHGALPPERSQRFAAAK